MQGAARVDRLVRRSNAKLTPDRVRYFCHPDWVVAAEARPPESLWAPAIRTPTGLKAYGAGILSSAAEVKHALLDKNVERLPFEAMTVMRRPYEIDKLQNTYFVLDDFRQLFEAAQTRVV